jgi:hypothetical protein
MREVSLFVWTNFKESPLASEAAGGLAMLLPSSSFCVCAYVSMYILCMLVCARVCMWA